MERSEDIKEIATALASAQGEIGAAAKNTDNPYFKSRYADIAAILDVIRPAAAKYGLCYPCFPPEVSNKRVVRLEDKDGVEYDEYLCDVTTTMLLMHTSGQWLKGQCTLTAIDSSHGVGSASTYGIRYCLRAMFAVATEDDDGNAAKSQGQPAKRREPPQPKQQTRDRDASEMGRSADIKIEEQLRASVNQQTSGSGGPPESELARLVAEACKSLGINKVQHTQMCMDEYGHPWAEMTIAQRRDQLAKVSARLAGAS